MPSRL
ncbi:hypothetical protein AZE42_07854, partial [Rhizopogon vesiculosus]